MAHQHDFKKINETRDGLLEMCQECKFRLVTKRDPRTGRIDNKKYLKHHVRDTAQPNGRTSKIFNKYYGEDAGFISRYKR